MSFIPDITCRHCGKKFSAIHSRCPHCGAKKVKQPGTLPPKMAQEPAGQPTAAPASGQRAKSGGMAASLFQGNTRWQFLFGCALILLVIIAVIVLITTSLKGSKEPPAPPPTNTVEVTTQPPTPSPTPTPTPTIPVTSVSIYYLNDPLKEFTQRIEWGDIQLKAEVFPVEALTTAKVKWRSTDEAVITVDDTGLVHPVASGVAEIVAECGGVAASCKVWVP